MFKIITSKKMSQLQWLQDISQINGDSLKNVHISIRLFQEKKMEYLKDNTVKTMTLVTYTAELIKLRRVTNLEVTW
jgi:hypothetical protein